MRAQLGLISDDKTEEVELGTRYKKKNRHQNKRRRNRTWEQKHQLDTNTDAGCRNQTDTRTQLWKQKQKGKTKDKNKTQPEKKNVEYKQTAGGYDDDKGKIGILQTLQKSQSKKQMRHKTKPKLELRKKLKK